MWNKHILISMTRSFFVGGLVFFILSSCESKDQQAQVLIEWKGNKPTGIIISHHFIGKNPQAEIREIVTITKRGDTTAILGDFLVLRYETVFQPVIPFTRGMGYEVKKNGKVVATFEIDLPKEKAEVLQVYPTSDTVPVNMLKLYIEFSLPMQSGDVLQPISLVKDGKDTLKDVFLDLQNELWSNDRTMLTLWLDPGRIKRGLQPNKLLGPPLEKGHHYKLIIHKDWMAENGAGLSASFEKIFFTTSRDDEMPGIMKWQLSLPKANTRDSLLIKFNEALDYQSAKHSVGIYDTTGILPGEIIIDNNERHLIFYPNKPWKAGKYIVDVAPGLEDIAGNNLVKPFDNDLQKPLAKPVLSRAFTIR